MKEPVKQIESSNYHDDLQRDFHANAPHWREITETQYYEALGCLPPIYRQGGWMMGEPYIHTKRGAVYAGYVEHQNRYFARNLHELDFTQEAANLRAALNGKPKKICYQCQQPHADLAEAVNDLLICPTCKRRSDADYDSLSDEELTAASEIYDARTVALNYLDSWHR